MIQIKQYNQHTIRPSAARQAAEVQFNALIGVKPIAWVNGRYIYPSNKWFVLTIARSH